MNLGWRVGSLIFTAGVCTAERSGRSLQGESIYRRPMGGNVLRLEASAALEDKIVQQAVVTILNQIYEVDFEEGFSYRFRPGLSPHQALDALAVGLERKKDELEVLDADIRGFFDNMSHEWTT